MAFKDRMASFLTRLEKAKALVREGRVHPVQGLPDIFVVESQEGKGLYLVDLGQETCTCPAWTQGKTRPCKHLVAAALQAWLEGEGRSLGGGVYTGTQAIA